MLAPIYNKALVRNLGDPDHCGVLALSHLGHTRISVCQDFECPRSGRIETEGSGEARGRWFARSLANGHLEQHWSPCPGIQGPKQDVEYALDEPLQLSMRMIFRF
jgi:hypothetical protein